MTAMDIRPTLTVGSWSRRRARSRTRVHLGLLVAAAGTLVTLQFLHVRVAIHTGVGLAFVGLVGVHLLQRRKTLARWATQLVQRRTRSGRLGRLASSDAVLAFITLNVTASGIVDWNRAQPATLPLLPVPLDRWHALSSIVLVIYVIVHVWHRRKRLRRSTIQ